MDPFQVIRIAHFYSHNRYPPLVSGLPLKIVPLITGACTLPLALIKVRGWGKSYLLLGVLNLNLISPAVPVSKRFVRQPEGGTGFVNINGGNTAEPSEDQFICEPTPAGSLVLIHGSVLHKSSRNTSDKSRNIYTFHVIEGEAEYPKDNWLQPTAEMPFTKLKDCA